ncbi:MAG: nucleotide exchange factor GrpE [bacterium]
MVKEDEIIYTDEEENVENMIERKIKKVKKQLKVCQKEKEEYLSQAQRARADLVNYRRRQEQLLDEFKKYSRLEFVKDLFPVIDTLEVAVSNIKDDDGIKGIYQQFENILSKYGVEEIEAVGQEFNPLYHEATEMVDTKEKSGIITEAVQKGYICDGRVLRVSRVKVAK